MLPAPFRLRPHGSVTTPRCARGAFISYKPFSAVVSPEGAALDRLVLFPPIWVKKPLTMIIEDGVKRSPPVGDTKGRPGPMRGEWGWTMGQRARRTFRGLLLAGALWS